MCHLLPAQASQILGWASSPKSGLFVDLLSVDDPDLVDSCLFSFSIEISPYKPFLPFRSLQDFR